jgi:endonuclease YncB( thermonuclease family)
VKYHTLSLSILLVLVPTLASAILYTQKFPVGDRVVKIIDGDTFKLSNKQTVRLASIDAPELDNCYGPEAKQALSDLILNKKVILLEPYSDQYYRLIAIVISDGQIINDTMVRNGYAFNLYDRLSVTDAVKDANKFARQNSLGIYSEKCSQVVPPNLDCLIKGNLDQREKEKYIPFLDVVITTSP